MRVPRGDYYPLLPGAGDIAAARGELEGPLSDEEAYHAYLEGMSDDLEPDEDVPAEEAIWGPPTEEEIALERRLYEDEMREQAYDRWMRGKKTA